LQKVLKSLYNNMQNLFELLEKSASRFGEKTALQIRDGLSWRKVSFRQLHDTAQSLAMGLKARGFGKGDALAILSESRPEWGIAFFAILRLGSVAVPVDKLLKKNEIQHVLETSGAKLVFSSGKYLELLKELPLKIPIISFDESPGALTLSQEIETGLKSPPLEENKTTRDDVAVMIFTSGTTGNPKGVMLTHGNFLSNVEAFSQIFPPNFFSSNFLSILPLNHCFELTGGFLTPLFGGGTITYQDTLKPNQVLQRMCETSTEIMLTVPAFLEVLYRNVMHHIEESPSIQKKFEFALKLASFFPIQAFRRYLFKDLHALFGGRLRYFVSGGAPLSGELQDAFEKLGFTVIQGYGLTETTPVLTVNPFRATRKNSVGKPIPGVEIKIDEATGEILAKGPNIMKGYYKNPEATEEVLKDGWFHTGDIGYFDKDGYLYISGRLKNLIVTSAGKKVFPEELEEKLKSLPYVKEVCVLGRKKGLEEEVVAVVIPDEEKLKKDGIPDNEIHTKIWDEIKAANAGIAEYKHIKDLILWKGEFPKTTTLKVKRKELEKLIEETSKMKGAASEGW
jgi:long-chain acyl-CoA synthetase